MTSSVPNSSSPNAMARYGPPTPAAYHRGQAVGKVNFVLRDNKDRLWVAIFTKVKNWMQALRTDLKDGYIAVYKDGRFRIVADGFGFTNEVRSDAGEQLLYVVETTGGCVTRLRLNEGGSLTNREVFGPSNLGNGAWPDGMAFDTFVNLWGTIFYSDKLFVLTLKGNRIPYFRAPAPGLPMVRWNGR